MSEEYVVWEILKDNCIIVKGRDQECVNSDCNMTNFYETAKFRTSWECCRQVVPLFFITESMKIN